MNPSSDQPPPPANPLGLAPGSPCLRAAIVLAILLTTAGLLWAMAMLRPRAAFRPPEERIREVRVCELRKGAQRATYLGYGTVRPEREVELAAEVRGRIVHLRPGLKDGVLVAAGEELLRIDPADYEAMRDQAAAEVAQITASLERLDRREDDDRERLVLLERDVALVEINLMRLRSLAEHKASSASIAEQAEQAFLQRRNTLITLRSMIAQVPAERAELKARLAAASARERTTTLDIDRCRIVAPFPGRIGRLAVEAGNTSMSGSHCCACPTTASWRFRCRSMSPKPCALALPGATATMPTGSMASRASPRRSPGSMPQPQGNGPRRWCASPMSMPPPEPSSSSSSRGPAMSMACPWSPACSAG